MNHIFTYGFLGRLARPSTVSLALIHTEGRSTIVFLPLPAKAVVHASTCAVTVRLPLEGNYEIRP
jgi:hypothetical protein